MTDLISSEESLLPPEGLDGFKFGGFWRRVNAFSADSIFSLVMFAALGYVWDMFWPIKMGSVADVTGAMNYYLYFFIIYGTWSECTTGLESSPGKYFFKLKVVNANGQKIGPIRALLRNVIKVLSSLVLVPFLVAAFTPQKRALHDIMSGTYVVFRG